MTPLAKTCVAGCGRLLSFFSASGPLVVAEGCVGCLPGIIRGIRSLVKSCLRTHSVRIYI